MIIVITKNEARNKNLINYYIIKNDKYFDYNYYRYFEIDKKKIINYTINDRIIIIIYKIANLDFNNLN